MMFLNSLTDLFRKRMPANKTRAQRPTERLRLEQLEDRIVPFAGTASTYTNAAIQITPGFTVTETVTANVTTIQGFNGLTGQFTAVPTGAGNNPTSGTVLFSLNNQTASGTLNGNGQATATFQIPLLSFLTSQQLSVNYQGSGTAAAGFYGQSFFNAPVYKNFDNVLLPSTITYTPLTLQQIYASSIFFFQNPTATSLNALPPGNSAQGVTDSLGNGLFAFNYVDPGTINTVTALGMQLPGIFALQLGAYNGFNITK